MDDTESPTQVSRQKERKVGRDVSKCARRLMTVEQRAARSIAASLIYE